MTDDYQSITAGLQHAQQQARQLLDYVEEHQIVRPGQTEQQISRDISSAATDMFGFEDVWHPNMIRSGPNTLLTFVDAQTDRTVQPDDIVYADLGPVLQMHKADFARTWVLGEDEHKLSIASDAQRDLERGIALMQEHPEMTGEQVYAMVGDMAQAAGWSYCAAIAGHIVGAYPDAEDIKFTDDRRNEIILAPGHTEALNRLRPDGLPYHWVLEVHYVDTAREIGAFVEDIATLPKA